MIDKDKLKYVAVCDICNDEAGPFDTFQNAIDFMKKEDWIAEKVDGSWDNICNVCAGDGL